MTVALTVLITLGVGIVFASFFEWTLHKYILHRPFWFLKIGFEGHTRIHHMKFKFDHTYHLQDEADAHIIDMKRWAPVLILGGSVPYLLALLLLDMSYGWVMLATGLFVSVVYYVLYEYLHWCMHLPKNRQVELLPIFRRLNGHHLLHHRFMAKNFNVVLPLADWCMGTLLHRSPIQFKQARGPAVPDVQPK